MKTCSVCKQEKSLDEFHKRAGAKDGKQSKCKECNKTTAKKWQADNADKHEEYWRNREATKTEMDLLRSRARRYGLKVDELQKMLDDANGVCTICLREPNKWLVVDHCHNTLKVRGILCEQCNQALGLFRDDVEVMQRAIEYLNNNGPLV